MRILHFRQSRNDEVASRGGVSPPLGMARTMIEWRGMGELPPGRSAGSDNLGKQLAVEGHGRRKHQKSVFS